MGVHGLWKLLESAGKPVPVETLENKVLAVDVSIWLHQAARGFQDARGQALPNAHLLGLFHRLCKLLFWRVRPVFVFDGGTPHLKQQTVAARRRRREDAQGRAERNRRRVLELHLRKYAVLEALRQREGGPARTLPPLVLPPGSQPVVDDLFTLPPVPRRRSGDEEDEEAASSDDDARSTISTLSTSTTSTVRTHTPGSRSRVRVRGREVDLHSVDVRSADFLALPADVRHEILTELKETRKQNSWGRLHEMPRESGDFSSYQMKRLLQRRSVQESLEAVEKEMGGRSMSLAELEELMAETGALAAALPGKRIAADEHTRFILVTGTRHAAGDAESQIASKTEESTSASEISTFAEENISMVDTVSLPNADNETNEHFEEYFSDEEIAELLPEFDYAKSSKVDSDDFVSKQLMAAHNFIFENSGLTQEEIFAVIKDNSCSKRIHSLDEPSTSKAGCSIIEELPNPQDRSNCSHDVIPSTSSSSELDMMFTSKDLTSDFSEKQSDQTSIQIEDISRSSHSSSISKNPNFVCDVKDNVMKLDIEQSDDDKETKNKKIKDTIKTPFQQSPDPSAVSLLKLPREKEVSSHAIPISNPTQNISSKVHMEGNVKDVSEESSCQSSQVTSESVINISSHSEEYQKSEKDMEEKNSCSSDEDFVEVAVANQSAVNFNISQKSHTKVSPLEVVIKTGIKDLEEDIFADVFETHSEPLGITKPAMAAASTLTNEISSSYSNTISKNAPQNFVQKNEFFQEIIKNTEVTETSGPVSSTSNSEDVMVMTDSSSEEAEAEEITKSPKVSEKSNDNKPEREPVKLSTEQLEKLQDSLQQEGNRLQREQAREERLAASITEQMVQEAQELLQLFGVPYVVAPMEAEAQCAFLDRLSLTDGTITDDSDIWLFGGQKVYKNFFDQKKHVLQFRDIDILQSFKLTRSQLVLLALLVGSDYTTGLPGVGPVTALEILAAFPSRSKQGPPDELVEGLRRFREWYTSGTVGRWDKAKLRNKLKDLELTGEFPSESVVEAYLSPKVDESTEKFSWGSPDVESIKEFARVKFGWPTSKTHEILQPIMKKLNIKISQLTIETYFKPKPSLPPGGGNLSKRVQEAIEKIGASEGSECEDDPPPAKKLKAVSEPTSAGMSENIRKIQASLNKVRGSAFSPSSNRGRGRGIKRQNNEGVTGGETDVETPGISIPGSSGSTSSATPLNNPGSTKKIIKSGPVLPSSGKEFILQKEKDKLNLLKNKLKAIEIFRKSARGLDKTQRDRKKKRMVLKQAHLSESSESD